MATLEEEADLPGGPAGVGAEAGRVVARCEPAGAVPAGAVAPGPAQGAGLAVDGDGGPAPARPLTVHPEYQPREPGADNPPVSGEPPAPSEGRGALPITPTQRAIAEARLADPEKSQKDIARELGVCPNTVSQALSKPAVRMMMSQHLDAAGAGLAKTAQRISEGMDAEKITYFQKDGEVTDERVDVDHRTRLEAAELAMEGHGVKEQAGVQVNIYQDLSDEQLAAVASGAAKMTDFIDLRPAA